MAQNSKYNALPDVQQRAQEYRRGPVGYPIKVINDAIRSVRARYSLRRLFTHLTILYSRHFEYDKLADEVTKTARNAALCSELALFVDHHMAASGRCAQFNSILVRSAKSCNSLFINRCSHNTSHPLHLLTHVQDRLCSHRLQAQKRQCAGASYLIFFMCVCPIQFQFYT